MHVLSNYMMPKCIQVLFRHLRTGDYFNWKPHCHGKDGKRTMLSILRQPGTTLLASCETSCNCSKRPIGFCRINATSRIEYQHVYKKILREDTRSFVALVDLYSYITNNSCKRFFAPAKQGLIEQFDEKVTEKLKMNRSDMVQFLWGSSAEKRWKPDLIILGHQAIFLIVSMTQIHSPFR